MRTLFSVEQSVVWARSHSHRRLGSQRLQPMLLQEAATTPKATREENGGQHHHLLLQKLSEPSLLQCWRTKCSLAWRPSSRWLHQHLHLLLEEELPPTLAFCCYWRCCCCCFYCYCLRRCCLCCSQWCCGHFVEWERPKKPDDGLLELFPLERVRPLLQALLAKKKSEFASRVRLPMLPRSLREAWVQPCVVGAAGFCRSLPFPQLSQLLVLLAWIHLGSIQLQ
mmetsp:Transcript_70407/g.153504  ORF Transcript_70407/g.153504 Transcript_70407/m.153504 type:complete len:224 (+) Transcript_70407:2367-3038(+)